MAEGRAPRINGHMLANVSYNRPALTARPSADQHPLRARRPLPRELPWPARARGAAPSRPVQMCVCVCVCVCVLPRSASSADPLASRMDRVHAAPGSGVRRVRWPRRAAFGVCLAHAAVPVALLARAILTHACPACAPARRRYSHRGRTCQGQRSGARGASRGPLRRRHLHRPLGRAAEFHH
jgi:hypothetical protein